jgi:hypothetical protein
MDATLDDLQTSDTPEVRDEALDQDAAESRKSIFETIKTGVQKIGWYSMRYWRQGVAAVTIYSAMFVIWTFAVR